MKHLSIVIIFLVGCNQEIKHPERLSLDWEQLNAQEYKVQLITLDYNAVPTEKTLNLNLIDYVNSDSSIFLNPSQIQKLSGFVEDSTNFTGGECGTFFLNGGFVITKADTMVGKIEIGCGFCTWFFSPDNQFSEFGSISDSGFVRMSNLLDDIYLSKPLTNQL